MKLKALCASAVTVLALGSSGCGDGEKGAPPANPPAGGGAPAETPPWTANPGQTDKVVALLTSKAYACSSMDGSKYRFTVCAKMPASEPSKAMVWMKLVTAADGTVVFVRTSGAQENRDGLAAVMGDRDATILLADGKTIGWGTTDGSAATVQGLSEDPSYPPVPEGFGASKEDMLAVYQPDPDMNCQLTEPIGAGPNADPGPGLWCRLKGGSDDPKVSIEAIEAVTTGDRIVVLRLSAGQSAGAPAGPVTGSGDLPAAQVFARAEKALLQQTAKLWPALGGPDVEQVRSWVESRIEPNRNFLGYVAGRRVEVRSGSRSGFYSIEVIVRPERPGLDEPAR